MPKNSWIYKCGVSKDSLKSLDYYYMPKMRNILENEEDFIRLKLIGNGDTKTW
jgi:hypothetical protein